MDKYTTHHMKVSVIASNSEIDLFYTQLPIQNLKNEETKAIKSRI